jgi:hypothetical protein
LTFLFRFHLWSFRELSHLEPRSKHPSAGKSPTAITHDEAVLLVLSSVWRDHAPPSTIPIAKEQSIGIRVIELSLRAW